MSEREVRATLAPMPAVAPATGAAGEAVARVLLFARVPIATSDTASVLPRGSTSTTSPATAATVETVASERATAPATATAAADAPDPADAPETAVAT